MTATAACVDYADTRGARPRRGCGRSRKRPGGGAAPCVAPSVAVDARKEPAPRTAAASREGPPAAVSPMPPPPPPLDAAERARAALMASQLVAELQLTDQRADALAAHLVAARGFASFEELLDPELLDDLEALGPYGLLDVPRKKLAQRRQWWSRGEESLSPDIGPAMAALGLT